MNVVEMEEPADSALLELFSRFVDPSCLGYHHPTYGPVLDTVLGDRGVWLVAYDGEHAVGCLPFRRRNGPLGVVVNALPFFGANGAVLVDPAADGPAAREALLAAFQEAVASDGVVSATFYTPFLEDPELYEARLAPDEVVRKFTQYVALDERPPWPRVRRRNLRRAERAGLGVRAAAPDDAEALASIYRESCNAAGVPEKPAAYLRGVLDLATAEPEGPVRFRVAELAGEVVAGLVCFRGPATASYAVPFARSAVLPLQAGPLLVDDAVQDACDHGLRFWNFESSPRFGDGVFEYKRVWGSRLARYSLLCFYPGGRDRLAQVPPDELRAAYPWYFVLPIGRVGGTWEPPPDVDG